MKLKMLLPAAIVAFAASFAAHATNLLLPPANELTVGVYGDFSVYSLDLLQKCAAAGDARCLPSGPYPVQSSPAKYTRSWSFTETPMERRSATTTMAPARLPACRRRLSRWTTRSTRRPELKRRLTWLRPVNRRRLGRAQPTSLAAGTRACHRYSHPRNDTQRPGLSLR